MDSRSTAHPAAPSAMSVSQGHLDEMLADLDEPPDMDQRHFAFWSPPNLHSGNVYAKAPPPAYARRESLLTRQLHSETDHTDDEHHPAFPPHTLSAVSSWSNPSTTSTAELTSDDGRSMPSPTISPPLLPTRIRNALPVTEKPLSNGPKILGLDAVTMQDQKDPVEAGLGRKRCITFACGNKDKATAVKPAPPPAATQEKPASPPKRKCMLKFACPTKVDTNTKPAPNAVPHTKRAASPLPTHRRTPSSPRIHKTHRGSDSTVTNQPSPRLIKKSTSIAENDETKNSTTPIAKAAPPLPLDDSDDSGAEATRFHEFAMSEDEPDEWVQESTCHRNRLFVTDTLQKENVIRQLGEEVEEEVLEEEEEEEEVDDDEADGNEDVDIQQADADDDAESDAGFHSDDEEGFARSDSENDADSDNEWWTPGGMSTAATSADHLDQMAHHRHHHLKPVRNNSASSLGSVSSGHASLGSSRRPRHFRNHSKSSAVPIGRPGTPDLPDSTDFVCGTLDEDRPREQAYIASIKERNAAKHRPVPQDIDPTFPTSDPDMDEEDDEDLDDAASSAGEEMLHGSLDEIHGTARRTSPMPRRSSIRHRSPPPPPPPPARRRSPAPAHARARSPAPVSRIAHRSPPPPGIRSRSPAPFSTRVKSPAPKARHACRSPPPHVRARSPAPRKLFDRSPHRLNSPVASGAPMSSPPNTRRSSPSAFLPIPSRGLAARPAGLTATASLPKQPGGFLLSHLGALSMTDVDSSDTVGPSPHDSRGGRRRGAIDIVKGLEKKRVRRREKLAQKAAAKAAVRCEERRKVKPGRGCQRMREVGLEVQKYKGGAVGHILSY